MSASGGPSTTTQEQEGPVRELAVEWIRALPGLWERLTDSGFGQWTGRRAEQIRDVFSDHRDWWFQQLGRVVLLVVAAPLALWVAGQALLWARGTVVGSHFGALEAVVTDPVRHYFEVHAAAALPVGADVLFPAWQTAGVVLLAAAFFWKSWGARLGWLVYGTVTVAMVWAGTAATGRDLAAGIAAIAWALSLIPVLRGVRFSISAHSSVTNEVRPSEATVSVTVPEPKVERVEILKVDINGRTISSVD